MLLKEGIIKRPFVKKYTTTAAVAIDHTTDSMRATSKYRSIAMGGWSHRFPSPKPILVSPGRKSRNNIPHRRRHRHRH